MIQSPNIPPLALKCPLCGANLIPGYGNYAVCRYCGSSQVRQRTAASGTVSQAPSLEAEPGAQAVKGYRLKLLAVRDSKGTDLEVFRMLVPQGWKFQGGVGWLLNNPSMPAGYEYAWANNLGEYIVTESADFNPNIGSDQNWTPMEQT